MYDAIVIFEFVLVKEIKVLINQLPGGRFDLCRNMRVIRRIVKIATVTATIIVPRFLLSCTCFPK